MKKKIEIKDIPDNIPFEGYVWMSDETKPKVLQNKLFACDTIGTNPFVIEGLLWDKKNKVSYHITHSGKYYVYRYNLTDLPSGAQFEEVNYLPHQLDGVNMCKFKQLWVPEKDPLCEDMQVLVMKALIFVGFD